MNGDDEKKSAAVPEEVVPTGPVPFVAGVVTIEILPNGAMSVNSPQNTLIALAIVKAGEVFLEKQMMDGMRRAEAMRPPTIVPANAGALKALPPIGAGR